MEKFHPVFFLKLLTSWFCIATLFPTGFLLFTFLLGLGGCVEEVGRILLLQPILLVFLLGRRALLPSGRAGRGTSVGIVNHNLTTLYASAFQSFHDAVGILFCHLHKGDVFQQVYATNLHLLSLYSQKGTVWCNLLPQNGHLFCACL